MHSNHALQPHLSTWLLFLLAQLICSGHTPPAARAQETETAAAPGSVIAKMGQEVEKVQPFVTGQWTKKWIAEVANLEKVRPRRIQVKAQETLADESLFYSGRYGSPLTYARALDLAEKHSFSPKDGSKVFDFGYGSIGHLRMLAQMGIDVTACDVDPLLPILYSECSGPYRSGRIQLLDGKFPADSSLVQKAGDSYDLFLSKNTLKLGYIHPTREPASPRHVIDLGVTDEVFLRQVASMLKPQGLFVIYNFCPPKAPDDKPYIPWAEGESPFTKELFEAAGFEVLEWNVVDDKPARDLGRLLSWDTDGGMDLENGLFAWYTIARKK
ncbi:MAG: class I SAM-dependent methyltransferase [Pirellulaceae bacterium]